MRDRTSGRSSWLNKAIEERGSPARPEGQAPGLAVSQGEGLEAGAGSFLSLCTWRKNRYVARAEKLRRAFSAVSFHPRKGFVQPRVCEWGFGGSP